MHVLVSQAGTSIVAGPAVGHIYVLQCVFPVSAEYAQVLRMLGNGRLEAQCIDGIKRLCHIRGKMRKKVWVNMVSSCAPCTMRLVQFCPRCLQYMLKGRHGEHPTPCIVSPGSVLLRSHQQTRRSSEKRRLLLLSAG